MGGSVEEVVGKGVRRPCKSLRKIQERKSLQAADE